ncbi:helix-turn-helix domain-containing protein [Paenibacillus ferrarius]|uniref:helix-turn-helix domain-containing protein n=1 Tax=Paenibacillus ferrarius TaxID=1469647 RepID=UPI003D2AE9D0
MRNLLRLPIRSNKQSVFRKYVFSYLLFLCLPIAFGIQQYVQTHEVLTKSATDLSLQILRMSQNTVDRLFIESDNVVSEISDDNNVLSMLLNANSPPTTEQLYNYSLLRSSLNRYVITNKLFEDIFICIANSGMAVSSKTAFNMNDNVVSINGMKLSEWLDEVSKRSTQKQYYSLNNVTIEGKQTSVLAYVSPLPNGVQGKVLGSIIVFIDQRDISSLFQFVVEDGGYAYIQGEQGQFIAPTFTSDQLKNGLALPETLSGKLGSSFEELGGKSMLVSHSRSDQNGWTYIAAQPSSVVLAKADTIKRAILMFAGFTLGLGILAALFLAYRNSKPFSELLNSMSELRSQIEHQLPLLRASVLDRLLKGYYKDEEGAKAALEEAHVQLQGAGYFSISVTANRDDWGAIGYEGMEEVHSFLKDRLEHMLEGFDFLMNMDGNRADLIVAYETTDWEVLRALIRERWAVQADMLQEENGLLLTIGAGRGTALLHELWRSHNEARQALEYHIPTDRGELIWYQERVQDSSYYYYPLDIELKLIQTVKNGDREGLERLMQHLLDVNLQERRLNTVTRRQLQHELQGTLIKLLEQVEASSDSLAELREKALQQAESGETFSPEAWKKVLHTICEHLAHQKKDKYNKTATAILEMTKAQFTDANFSLSGLASYFKLSESFISILFKDHVGENFSDYVERLRLELACGLLKGTDKSIVLISQESGYNSDKTFRRAFKRVYGIQPTSYRESAHS